MERREDVAYCYRRDDVLLLSRRAMLLLLMMCLLGEEEVEVACSQRSVVDDLWREDEVRTMLKGDSDAT